MRFRKEVLRPGTYNVGGRRIKITADDVRRYAATVPAIHKAGYSIPLVYEHGDELPMSQRERDRENAKNSVGFVEGLPEVTEDGRLSLAFNVPDESMAKKITDGIFKFVSPMLKPQWLDGVGNTFRDAITHVALTHKPVQLDQTAGFVALSQCDESESLAVSLENIEGAAVPADSIPFAQLDDEKRPARAGGNPSGSESPMDDAKPAPPENPDMPPNSDDGKRLESVLAYLAEIGIKLPTDTDGANILERLQVALMTHVEAKSKAEEEAGAADTPDGSENQEVREENPRQPMYFSQTDDGHAIARRITKLGDKKQITPALRDALLDKLPSIELSQGDYGKQHLQPTFTIVDLVTWIEGGCFADALALSQGANPDDLEQTPGNAGMLDDREPSEFIGRNDHERADEVLKRYAPHLAAVGS